MTLSRFTKEHEWAALESDTATCGITDYAQKALGDIVYVELPPIGKKVRQGEQVAVVESTKAASEVFAPLDGEVIAVNEALASDPGAVNRAAMSEGWFFKLKVSDSGQVSSLMDDSAYARYVQELIK
ncbi:MAG: glycine cleavage system protein GcvH [Bdellovibrionales bacterium]